MRVLHVCGEDTSQSCSATAKVAIRGDGDRGEYYRVLRQRFGRSELLKLPHDPLIDLALCVSVTGIGDGAGGPINSWAP
jgi:hypothetical protein